MSSPVMACNKLFVLVLIIFLVSSCKNEVQQSCKSFYSDFPEERSLQGETIELDTAIFRYAFRIRVKDDRAVIMDLHGIDYYYHVFKYPKFQYLSSFGARGDSPSEMLSAENIRYMDDELWALDANKSELSEFKNSLSDDSLLCNKVVKLDKEMLRVLDFVIYDDSTYIIPDYSGENRFCWVDHKGKLLRKNGTIPSTNGKILAHARPALAQAWRSFLDYNSGNGVLATVTQLGEVLEVYNFKDTTHVVRVGPLGEPEFKVSGGYGVPTGIMGFSDVQVTDSAIYTVFHGRSFKDISRQKDNIDGGKYIYVFSLQGEPICKYTLDRYIYGIYVDEEKKIIIATDVNNDQPIVQFHINGNMNIIEE